MTKTIHLLMVVAMVVALGCTVRYAQAANSKAGETTYSARCKMCHGPKGVANPAIAKMMKVEMKPLGSAAVQKLTNAEITAIIKKGKEKMRPVAGLSDAQISNVVAYVRTLKK